MQGVGAPSFHCVPFCATWWTGVYQAPLFMGFSRQEYWSGLLFPSPLDLPNPGIGPASSAALALQNLNHWTIKQVPYACCACVQNYFSLVWFFATHGLQPARLLCPWDFPGKNTGVGSLFLLHGLSPVRWVWKWGAFPHLGKNLHWLESDTIDPNSSWVRSRSSFDSGSYST